MSLQFYIAVIISVILQDKKHAAHSPWVKGISQLYVQTLHSLIFLAVWYIGGPNWIRLLHWIPKSIGKSSTYHIILLNCCGYIFFFNLSVCQYRSHGGHFLSNKGWPTKFIVSDSCKRLELWCFNISLPHTTSSVWRAST